MSISDAQFIQWLETSKQRTSLFNINYVGTDGSGNAAIYQFRASNSDYGPTGAAESPANTIYENCIVEIPQFSRRMGEQLEGRTSQTTGDLIIANPNGERNYFLSMNWDGGTFEHWLGDPSWPIADFRLVLKGVTQDIFDAGGNKLGFKLGDKGVLLDRPIMTTLIGGTSTDAKMLRPLVYGFGVTNITPRLVDATNLIFRVTETDSGGLVETQNTGYVSSGGYGDAIWAVREKGKSLSGGFILDFSDSAQTVDVVNDYIIRKSHGLNVGTRVQFVVNTGTPTLPTGLSASSSATVFTNYWVIAAGITNDRFKLSLTKGGSAIDLSGSWSGSWVVHYYNYTALTGANDGCFQLAAAVSDTGTITCDCTGLMMGGLVQYYPGRLIKQILTSGKTNTLLTSSDIDATSLTAFDAIFSSFNGIMGIYVNEQKTFAALMDEIVLSVGGWWGFNRAGKLIFGRLDLPVAGTPAYSFISDDMAARSLKLSRRILPRAVIKIRGGRNWTVQDVSGVQLDNQGLPTDRVAYYNKEWAEEAVGNNGSVSWTTNPTTHVSATYPDPYETHLLVTQTQGEANRLATMFREPTGIYTFDTHQIVYSLELGNLIYVETSKFTGYGTVVGIAERPKNRSTIDFFAALPNYYPTQLA